MKNVAATFPNADSAQAAVEALDAAGIPDTDIIVQDATGGSVVVSATVDDGKLDAVAAILRTASATNIEDRAEVMAPEVEGHPDGSGPVVLPLTPNR